MCEATTGITNEMVKSAPKIEHVVPEIEKRLKNKIVVAHNATFDLAFIQNEICKYHGQAYSIDYFCTLSAARRLLDLTSNSLPALAKHFNYGKEIAHRAKGDSLALEHIYKELMKIIDPTGLKKNSYFYNNDFIKCYTKFIHDSVETKSYFQEQEVAPVLVSFKYCGAQKSCGKIRRVVIESLRSEGNHIYFCGECLDSKVRKQFRSDRISGSIDFPDAERSILISKFSSIAACKKILVEMAAKTGVNDLAKKHDIKKDFPQVINSNTKLEQSSFVVAREHQNYATIAIKGMPISKVAVFLLNEMLCVDEISYLKNGEQVFVLGVSGEVCVVRGKKDKMGLLPLEFVDIRAKDFAESRFVDGRVLNGDSILQIVSIYDNPEPFSNPIGYVEHCEIIQAVKSNNKGWVYINSHQGLRGWIKEEFCLVPSL